MKGLILAAGRGTRLKPLTDGRSKPMVLLANRPLIHYAIDKLVEVGITDIGIVVSDNEDELRGTLAYPGAELTFIRQPEPLGLAHAVGFAREFTGDDEFVVLFCDNLFSINLHGALDDWQLLRGDPGCECIVHVHEVRDPRACGVAVVHNGWVEQLEEKPAQPKSKLAVMGIYFFTPRIYDAITRIKPSARGELEITDAISELITMGQKVRALRAGGYWFDTGTLRDLLTAQARVMTDELYELECEPQKSRVSGSVGIPADCVVESCTIEGPLLVGSGSTLSGSRIGPNVAVAAGCRVTDCELSDCQLYPGTVLSGVQARGAIFDGDTRIDI